MSESIAQISKSQQNYMVALRRKLHAAPELSFQERGTSELVREELEKLNIPYEVAGDYGLVATIEGTNDSQMMALRADMDALPIHEKNEHLAYRSKTPV